MDSFAIGPEGMDVDEFNQRVDSLLRGGRMEITEQFTLAEMGRLYLANRALEAKVVELQAALESQGSDSKD